MNALEEKIMLYVCENPGSRKREIADGVNTWMCGKPFKQAMRNLENDGVLRHEPYRDAANMEYYDKWYVMAP